jgi:hypothetical protein
VTDDVSTLQQRLKRAQRHVERALERLEHLTARTPCQVHVTGWWSPAAADCSCVRVAELAPVLAELRGIR